MADKENENGMDDQYWKMTEEYIRISNRLNKTIHIDKVASAMLYSAARYNAYHFTKSSGDIVADKEAGMQFYVEQFKKMLEMNIDDFIKMHQQDSNNHK